MGGSLLIILLSVTGGICLSTCICIYNQCNRIDNSISDNTAETVTITKEHYENLI